MGISKNLKKIFIILSIIIFIVSFFILITYIDIKPILKYIQIIYNKNKVIGLLIILTFQILNSVLNLPFYCIFNLFVVFIVNKYFLSIIIVNISTVISNIICYFITKYFKNKIYNKLKNYNFIINLEEKFIKEPIKTALLIKSSILLGGMKNYICALFLKNIYIFIFIGLISNMIPTLQIIIISRCIYSIDSIFNKKINYYDLAFLLISVFLNVLWVIYFKNIFKNNTIKFDNW